MNVLIVDDSAMMRCMIKRVVSLAGVAVEEVYEAANGREAIAILETRHVDVLLTDLNLPVMTGAELLREIERRGWTELVRVIVSTDGSAVRRDQMRELHVRLYVEKPFRPEAMRDALSEVLASSAR